MSLHVTHEFDAFACCPVNGRPDYYRVTVITDRQIDVEMLLDAARAFEGQEVYQEHLTAHLAEEFEVTVTTVGVHSGVRTTVTAGP